MYLENFLNENMSQIAEPIHQSFITGEDTNELEMVNYMAISEMYKIAESTFLNESVCFINNLKNSNNEYLQENIVVDFFVKIKEIIVKMWNAIRDFFKNLFKSSKTETSTTIEIASNIDKSVDLTDFKYNITNWKETDIPNKIFNNCKKLLNEIAQSVRYDAKNIQGLSKGDISSSIHYNDDDKLLMYDRFDIYEYFLNPKKIPNDITISTLSKYIHDAILEEYGYYQDGSNYETKSNPSDSEIAKIKNWLKKFDSSSELSTLESSMDSIYTVLYNSVEESMKIVNSIKTDKDTNIEKYSKNKKEIDILINHMQQKTVILHKIFTEYNTCIKIIVRANMLRKKEYTSILTSLSIYTKTHSKEDKY